MVESTLLAVACLIRFWNLTKRRGFPAFDLDFVDFCQFFRVEFCFLDAHIANRHFMKLSSCLLLGLTARIEIAFLGLATLCHPSSRAQKTFNMSLRRWHGFRYQKFEGQDVLEQQIPKSGGRRRQITNHRQTKKLHRRFTWVKNCTLVTWATE